MKELFPYVAVTAEVTVRVNPSYLADQSDPEKHVFVWAYHIRIENGQDGPVQLLSRYWRITDAAGRMQEVRGQGVVGDQPVIQPGDSYDYVSGCPLSTPSGIMAGSYGMTDAAGAPFEVEIPAFSLDSPHAKTRLN